MDQAITIRTLVFRGDEYSYQAGAGIVADSIPESPNTTKCWPRVPPAARARDGGGRPVSIAQPRLLLIDNYDSFTYNLVQAFLVLGAEVLVLPQRRDQRRAGAKRLAPTHLCISPGPGTPDDAGVSMDMIRAFAGRVPSSACASVTSRWSRPSAGGGARAALMHGKTSMIKHDGRGAVRRGCRAPARSAAITR
jgi:hypothetical protein